MQNSTADHYEDEQLDSSIHGLYYSADSVSEEVSSVHPSQVKPSSFPYWHQGSLAEEEDNFLTPHRSLNLSGFSWDIQTHVDSATQKHSHTSKEYSPASLQSPNVMNTYTANLFPDPQQCTLSKNHPSHVSFYGSPPREELLPESQSLPFLYRSPAVNEDPTEKTIEKKQEELSSTLLNDTWTSSTSQETSVQDVSIHVEEHHLTGNGETISLEPEYSLDKSLAGLTDSDGDSRVVTPPGPIHFSYKGKNTAHLVQDTSVSVSTEALQGEHSIFSLSTSLSSDVQSEPCSLAYSSVCDLSRDPSPSADQSFDSFTSSLNSSSFNAPCYDTTSCVLTTPENFFFQTPCMAPTLDPTPLASPSPTNDTFLSHTSQDTQPSSELKAYYDPFVHPCGGVKSTPPYYYPPTLHERKDQQNALSCMCYAKNTWRPEFSSDHCNVSANLLPPHQDTQVPQCSSNYLVSPTSSAPPLSQTTSAPTSNLLETSTVLNSVYRLSRSPTARAAIVQYPYPPVPAHCLPPLKHIQQQALFNEFLKIEKDALRVQLGHFIVEYCTRSIPDEYLRSERTPDPRIITDFVDQIILAVEIFGEQAQYVRAHTAIPTDINEVYISSWLQQKKEFLKPLEMLYIKREREKLLAGQNNPLPFQLNNVPYLIHTRHRKRGHTGKQSEDPQRVYDYPKHLAPLALAPEEKHVKLSQGIRERTARQSLHKQHTGEEHSLPRNRHGKPSRLAVPATTNRLTRRSGLCLSEELDGLGVPRTIHFENLRSAIEHRGIVVQLPSNNSSSLASSSTSSATSFNNLDSTNTHGSRCTRQYRSLFNLLISGRGDTRRSRLQLPWGDTVNIKYNRTLLGIPDFLVEGLGYAHLGNNHPLIPKVCAVSLEGSLYGVEVLLFYRGLPCTKRVGKRYAVQQYETRCHGTSSARVCSENPMPLYHLPQRSTTPRKTRYDLPLLPSKENTQDNHETPSPYSWTSYTKEGSTECHSKTTVGKETSQGEGGEESLLQLTKVRHVHRGPMASSQHTKRQKCATPQDILYHHTDTVSSTLDYQQLNCTSSLGPNVTIDPDLSLLDQNGFTFSRAQTLSDTPANATVSPTTHPVPAAVTPSSTTAVSLNNNQLSPTTATTTTSTTIKTSPTPTALSTTTSPSETLTGSDPHATLSYVNVDLNTPLTNSSTTENFHEVSSIQPDYNYNDFPFTQTSKSWDYMLYSQLQFYAKSEAEQWNPQECPILPYSKQHNVEKSVHSALDQNTLPPDPSFALQPASALGQKSCLDSNKSSEEMFYGKQSLVNLTHKDNRHLVTMCPSPLMENCSTRQLIEHLSEDSLLHHDGLTSLTHDLTYENEIDTTAVYSHYPPLDTIKKPPCNNHTSFPLTTLSSNNLAHMESNSDSLQPKFFINSWGSTPKTQINQEANHAVCLSADEWFSPFFLETCHHHQGTLESPPPPPPQQQPPAPLQRNRLMVSCSTVDKSLDNYHSYTTLFDSPHSRGKPGKKSKHLSLSLYGTPAKPQDLYTGQLTMLHHDSTLRTKPSTYTTSSALPAYLCSTTHLNIPHTVQNQNIYSSM